MLWPGSSRRPRGSTGPSAAASAGPRLWAGGVLCWRARVAGYRVLMTPLAQARHRDASVHGERPEHHRHRSSRYFAERAGLAPMLKDYGLLTLAWLLPP